MGVRKRNSAQARKEALKEVSFAKLTNVPSSPRKMRLVADMVRGKEVFRALGILSAMVGAYDTPAGNRGMTRVPINAGGVAIPANEVAAAKKKKDPNEPFVEQFDKKANIACAEEFPLTRWTARTDAKSCWVAALESKPYPIKGCVAVTGNFMNQSNATYAWNALKSLDFFVDMDLWHAPMTELADIKLPAQHWLEIPGFARISQGAHGAFGANVNCIAPPGEAKF